MSQPGSFDTTAVDPFFVYMDQEPFDHSQYDPYDTFGNATPASTNEALSAFHFPSTTTASSTPDFPYGFNTTTYPPPSPASPRPYPFETYRYLQPPTSPAYPFPPISAHPSTTTRRRSLSTSAIPHTPIPNPTVIRLQAPRGRPLAADPDHRARRSSPYPTHARSASHNYIPPSSRGSSGSSTSRHAHGYGHIRNNTLTSSLWHEMLPTPIGTPLDPPPGAPGAAQSAEVTFQRMPARFAAQSRRIIQLGALGVRRGHHEAAFGAREDAEGDECARLVKAMELVRAFLVRGAADEGVLGACGVVRGALVGMERGQSLGEREEMVVGVDGTRRSGACLGDGGVGSVAQSPEIAGAKALKLS